jgi:hypothetical protein
MRISTTSNATPQSTPPSSAGSRGGADASARDEHFIWHSLVPRLVHPTKLAIIEALIDAERPLSVDDLIPLLPVVDGNAELIRYHANSMVKAGALQVASVQVTAAGETPRFFFPCTA